MALKTVITKTLPLNITDDVNDTFLRTSKVPSEEKIPYFRCNEKYEMKKGDSVSVVDENLKGKIIAIQGKKVILEDEHGFRYEYDEAAIVLQPAGLYDEMQTVQKTEFSKSVSKKHHKKPILLDLHFENLVKNTAAYDSFERLFLQKEKLLSTLDYCRKNNLKKLEIIHGIGDGVLQQMVHDVLESQTNLEFHNKEILHHQSGTVLVFFR